MASWPMPIPELSPSAFRWRLALLLGLALVFIAAALALPAIPQNPAYHGFADTRPWLGIPNAGDVLSNLPFVAAGLIGLLGWRRSAWREPGDRWPWLVIALGTLLVGLGSGYYHLHPDNRTLFWDRLPMTLVFMALFAAALAERVHARAGLLLLLPFLALGVLSVLVWRRGELTGVGDLRFYLLVQFYPLVALPLCLLLFPARYDRGGDLGLLAAAYVAAKLCEQFDRGLFAALGGALSGHTLKHLLAAGGIGWVLAKLPARRPRVD